MPVRKANFTELPQPVQSRGPSRPPKDQSALEQESFHLLTGLYVFGQVVDRTRRSIQT